MNVKIFEVVQIILGVSLITSILMQVRGSGLSSVFGGSGGEYFRARRGIERFLYYETIVVAILFVACALVILILTK
jgi:protein translocase SecG subunit